MSIADLKLAEATFRWIIGRMQPPIGAACAWRADHAAVHDAQPATRSSARRNSGEQGCCDMAQPAVCLLEPLQQSDIGDLRNVAGGRPGRC